MFQDKIDLWQVGVQPRSFAAGLLFGPEGKLFVPINGGASAGEVRRYDVDTKQYEVFVPAGPPKLGGTLLLFENTDPATLAISLTSSRRARSHQTAGAAGPPADRPSPVPLAISRSFATR